MKKVNLLDKFNSFSDYWNPRIAGELNGQQVKLAKLHGEFIWHKHDIEDELFFVVRGNLTMVLRNGEIGIGEGEFFIVPKGVEHKPVAKEEVWVMLFEPAATLNTGDVINERTKQQLETI